MDSCKAIVFSSVNLFFLCSLQDLWKLKVYVPITLAFFVGALIGGLLAFQPLFLAIPAALLFGCGLIMMIVRVLFIKRSLAQQKGVEEPRISKKKQRLIFIFFPFSNFFLQRKFCFLRRLLLLKLVTLRRSQARTIR